ncbi:putative ADP-ribosylation factor-like protein 5C isoform X1 [Grammomys surdaster]|uniref:putative ADP-ribosylation factor-like protein 5C isoform X1 n=1 Tax=Grammomys surdaster TaxID=491861 RepID=UPI0010A064D5|nr:putative ADP-ribosylation factor-like protein 5C isoform X1 [Grammomys surdaster]
MGQLIVKLTRIFGSQEHKVIIVGLDNAGKTTILYQFLTNEVVHTCSTIGSNVEEIVFQKTHFLMWDLGGQEALRSTWDTYYSNAEFVILVIDSTDRNRLLTTREELYKMLAHEVGTSRCFSADLRQQAGCERLHDHSRDLPISHTQCHQRPLMAYPGLLCPHRRRAASWAPVDAISGHHQLMSQSEANQKPHG